MTSTEQKPMTAADRIRELHGRDKPAPLPPYVCGTARTDENPNMLAAKQAAQKAADDAKLKEEQEKARAEGRLPPPRAPEPPIKGANKRARLKMTLQDIAEASAPILGVKVGDLLLRSRLAKISHRRQVLMSFMLRYSGCSQPQVGKFFGFHNTTARHAHLKISRLLEDGPTRGIIGSPWTASEHMRDIEMLVNFRKLCRHFSMEPPPSEHWPPEQTAKQPNAD